MADTGAESRARRGNQAFSSKQFVLKGLGSGKGGETERQAGFPCSRAQACWGQKERLPGVAWAAGKRGSRAHLLPGERSGQG